MLSCIRKFESETSVTQFLGVILVSLYDHNHLFFSYRFWPKSCKIIYVRLKVREKTEGSQLSVNEKRKGKLRPQDRQGEEIFSRAKP